MLPIDCNKKIKKLILHHSKRYLQRVQSTWYAMPHQIKHNNDNMSPHKIPCQAPILGKETEKWHPHLHIVDVLGIWDEEEREEEESIDSFQGICWQSLLHIFWESTLPDYFFLCILQECFSFIPSSADVISESDLQKNEHFIQLKTTFSCQTIDHSMFTATGQITATSNSQVYRLAIRQEHRLEVEPIHSSRAWRRTRRRRRL